MTKFDLQICCEETIPAWFEEDLDLLFGIDRTELIQFNIPEPEDETTILVKDEATHSHTN